MNMGPNPFVITDEEIQFVNEWKSYKIDLEEGKEWIRQIEKSIKEDQDELHLNNQIRSIQRSAKKTPKQKQIKIFGGLYQPTRNERP